MRVFETKVLRKYTQIRERTYRKTEKCVTLYFKMYTVCHIRGITLTKMEWRECSTHWYIGNAYRILIAKYAVKKLRGKRGEVGKKVLENILQEYDVSVEWTLSEPLLT